MKIHENLDLQDLDGEIWKTIEEYPDYSTSNLGRVKSFKYNKINGKILKQYKGKDGYFIVGLCKNRESKNKQVHRLVYETFKEKLKDGYDAHHMNENKEDNFIKNLESKSHLEHSRDHNLGKYHSKETKIKMKKSHTGKKHSEETKNKISKGNFGKIKSEIHINKLIKNHPDFSGVNNPNFKLTNKKIIDIKNDIEEKVFSQNEIADKHGVCRMTISRIKTGKIKFYN